MVASYIEEHKKEPADSLGLSAILALLASYLRPSQVNHNLSSPPACDFRNRVIPYLIISQTQLMFDQFLQQKLWCGGKWNDGISLRNI